MQLQLNINECKANILFGFLDIFKQDDLIKDYKIVDTKIQYTEYEEEILNDLKDLKFSMSEDGIKTNKYIELN